MAEFEAQGRDIYGQGLTVRDVYEIEASVRPGNSGGPLVLPNGVVIGIVFSRSTTNDTIGYALTSPGVLDAGAPGGGGHRDGRDGRVYQRVADATRSNHERGLLRLNMCP